MFSVGDLSLGEGQSYVKSCIYDNQPYWHTCSPCMGLEHASRSVVRQREPAPVAMQCDLAATRAGQQKLGRLHLKFRVFFFSFRERIWVCHHDRRVDLNCSGLDRSESLACRSDGPWVSVAHFMVHSALRVRVEYLGKYGGRFFIHAFCGQLGLRCPLERCGSVVMSFVVRMVRVSNAKNMLRPLYKLFTRILCFMNLLHRIK